MERNHKNSLKKSRQQIVDVSINIMIYDSIKIFLFKILDKHNFIMTVSWQPNAADL